MTPFLSNSLKALVTGTVTNGFPSVTSVIQHLVFKMSFHDVLFTAPSPSPGGDEKFILIFQRIPVNYNTGLCIAYSLQYMLHPGRKGNFVNRQGRILFKTRLKLVLQMTPPLWQKVKRN